MLLSGRVNVGLELPYVIGKEGFGTGTNDVYLQRFVGRGRGDVVLHEPRETDGVAQHGGELLCGGGGGQEEIGALGGFEKGRPTLGKGHGGRLPRGAW